MQVDASRNLYTGASIPKFTCVCLCIGDPGTLVRTKLGDSIIEFEKRISSDVTKVPSLDAVTLFEQTLKVFTKKLLSN